jgi:hypothetical protein
MNPRWHEEFLSLCALFPTGELTDEEWALLQVHLAYCDSCLAAFREYEKIGRDVLPAIAASANSEDEYEGDCESSSFSLEDAEYRLNQKLGMHEGVEEFPARAKLPMRIAFGLIAASIAGVVCVGISHVRHERASFEVASHNARSVPEAHSPVVPGNNSDHELETARRDELELQRRLNKLALANQQANAKIATLNDQLKADLAEDAEVSQQRDAANQQLALKLAESKVLRDSLSAAKATSDEQLAQSSALEAKLREAKSELEEGERMHSLDKELLAHDRDIRDLIGARDLYITDIVDVTKTGKAAKPFGRVFYTKDRSLVFYGYDLDKQSGLAQSVSFQAWGSGEDGENVSLGMFYQDDSHKRWILKFDDTKTLAHLNKVFVTAEPHGGSPKPTGKPLLIAYLQVKANHP